ncbi:CRISPR-associated protein, Csh1 family [Desulforamulus putei DSM 12395]|uniref:CRISPR-associated protein, Csh1 family n=1 Tax=Desulforamulus putei DSM 12395 TaxID=1121429 RepID=A0A1M5AH05_9FIRM|nr:TIGR02556 family CRISPR-associated protein [Desulforamulus putei]SHF29548.1 CRISPR-associated protein, Csh1 family [Desulforamulus putei DSM 12395]
MISAVRELGLLSLKITGKDVLATLTETINPDKYPNMVVIELQKENEDYSFSYLSLEETNCGGAGSYLYRKGPPNGANFSPTALITEPEKTFQVKILGWFRTVDKLSLSQKDQKIITSVKKALEAQQQQIIALLKGKLADIKGSAGLTLKIDGCYLRDITAFRDSFLQLVAAKEDSISAQDKICSVCGQRKAKVSAGAPAYKFYTIDKPGFITGHFIKEKSWRNYPVCSECSLALDEGKRILEERYRFSFYGLSYYLVPKFILKEPSSFILNILTGEMDKNIKLNDNAGGKLTTNEDDILHELASEKDTMTLNFLFLRKEQSSERILLLVEDVLPSRLRDLFKAKAAVDRMFPQQPFHFGRIRTFFAKSDDAKRDNDLDKYFMELVDKIFKGLPVAMSFLATHFMREIRRDFNTSNINSFKLLDAIETVLFFAHLKMLGRKEVTMSTTIFDPIFDRFANQLNTPEKRGVFLLGALTRMLLNVQYAERKSQPFLVNLMGLKMDSRQVKGLLPKVINKLQEYKRFDKGKAQLAEAISVLLLESDQNWRMTVDELNFYFVCGMNMYNEANLILYGKKEEVDDTDAE